MWDLDRKLDEGDGTVLDDDLTPEQQHARFCDCLMVPDSFGNYDPCDRALQWMEEQAEAREAVTP